MRIRRNTWLACTLTATIPFLAATGLNAQNAATTTTKSAGKLSLEPGDQLIYSTSGKIAMEGGGQSQDQELDFVTSVTVLDKSDKYTMYASMAGSEETTDGKKIQTPGPRFTFELPLSGAPENLELVKAGLYDQAFPTFSMEALFTIPGEDGKSTVTTSLPISGAEADAEANTSRSGDTVKTVVTLDDDKEVRVLDKTAVFSSAKNVTESIDTSITMTIAAQGMPITFSIVDKTKLEAQAKLTPEQVAAIKADLETGVPVTAGLESLSPSDADAMKKAATDMQSYLEKYPEGEFAHVFSALEERLSEMVERNENWAAVKAGETPKDFTAKTIDGKTIKLSDYKGKVVLIDFWATWCGPCMMELPNVKKLYADYKDKGFEIIGVSADETQQDLEDVVESEKLEWPQIFDGDDSESNGDIQTLYGIMKYPTMVLVDREGKINGVDLRGEELEAAVKKLVEADK